MTIEFKFDPGLCQWKAVDWTGVKKANELQWGEFFLCWPKVTELLDVDAELYSRFTLDIVFTKKEGYAHCCLKGLWFRFRNWAVDTTHSQDNFIRENIGQDTPFWVRVTDKNNED